MSVRNEEHPTEPAPADGSCVIRGTITWADGRAARNMIVRARDRDLRGFQPLGRDAETAMDGTYEITYAPKAFARAEKGSADLVVRVFDDAAADPDKPVAESPVLFNAPAEAVIDLVIARRSPGGASEYDRYVDEIKPLLVGQGEGGRDLPMEALEPEDIPFIAGETSIDRQHITWLREAFALSFGVHSTTLAASRKLEGHQYGPALLYGWFREGIPDKPELLREQPLAFLRKAALAAVEHGIIPAHAAHDLESVLRAMPNAKRDTLRATLATSGVHDGTMNALLEHVSSVAELTNPLLARLVADGVIADTDAHRIGVGLTLYHVVGGDDATRSALLDALSRRPGGQVASRAGNIASLTAGDIEAALRAASVKPPADMSVADYAAAVESRIAVALPGELLLNRVTRLGSETVNAIRRDILQPVTTEDGAPPRDDHAELREFINLHPGLDLAGALKKATNATEALESLTERVGWMNRVRELNPNLDLLAIDYQPDSESLKRVRFDGLSDDARAKVVANIQGYQRVEAIGAGSLASLKLLKGGFRSATSLARATPEEIAERSGIPIAQARAVHASAAQKATEASIIWFAAHDLERDTRIINHRSLPQSPTYLKDLPGYDDLFGSVNFCACDQCQSVLGAAAYFVDLMHFVDVFVSRESFKANGGENNSLHLKRRRRDLWSLPLTCENTNKVVPSLDLVNALLETFIVTEKQLASVAQLYVDLADVDDSIHLPFSQGLSRITVLLSHLGVARPEIANTLFRDAPSPAIRARARLAMLPSQFRAITSGRLGDLGVAAITAAQQRFNLWLDANLAFSTIPGQTETRVLDSVGIDRFMRAADLDRTAARDVLASEFVTGKSAGVPSRIRLEAGIAAAGGVQNDVEFARYLTIGRLDRFESFARLWQHVPWTVAELDYVIGRLQPAGETRISESTVLAIGRLLEHQDQLNVPVDELCALWDALPETPLRETPALFERVFNPPSRLRQSTPWPIAGEALSASPANRARLTAALQLDDQELSELLTALEGRLGRITVDAAGNETFTADLGLAVRNLTLLYRHARLAHLLRLTASELLQTVLITPRIAGRPAYRQVVSSLADLQAVMETHRWRTASGFSIAELRYITTPGSSLAGFEDPAVLAARIAGAVVTEKALHFSAELFTQVGLTAEASKRVVEANAAGAPSLLEAAPGESAWRIAREVSVDMLRTNFVFNEEPGTQTLAAVARDTYRIVKLAGEAGFTPAAFETLGAPLADATNFVNANLSGAAADGRPFEQVPAAAGVAPRYRLRASIGQGGAINAFGALAEDRAVARQILRRQAQDLLSRYHSDLVLAARTAIATRVTPEKAKALLDLAKPADAQARTALVDALHGGPVAELSRVLDRVMRSAALFKSPTFDAATLEFVRANPAVFAFANPLTIETVRRVSGYARLATAPDDAFTPEAEPPDAGALRDLLVRGTSIADPLLTAREVGLLARALRTDESRARAVVASVSLEGGASRVAELVHLSEALTLAGRVGIAPDGLRLLVSEDEDELARGADGLYATIRSRYEDEKKFREALEPFEDKLRSLTRDGLVAYLLSAPDDANTDWRTRFHNARDLYYHFLTDVQVEGCARTSRVVAAISSVQLYVHRVLMNLEQSTDGTVAARVDETRQGEWEWRKNYQVWVANRKVFLFPENYVEPGIRDDKTPLFKELEDALLQQQVNEQNVLDAYASYLHGFEEVSRLRIAGAYHDRPERDTDMLHLFGVTASDPLVFYYRTIRGLESKDGPIFSAWRKIDLQIPVRRVAPIVYLGRLYVFWVETVTRTWNEFADGKSVFMGYNHTTRLKYSILRQDGRWSPPQAVKFVGKEGAATDTFAVSETLHNVGPAGSTSASDVRLAPVYDRFKRNHEEPVENYVPDGWRWEQIYPTALGTSADPENAHLQFGFQPRGFLNTSGPFNEIDLWSGTARIIAEPSTTYSLASYLSALGTTTTRLDLVVLEVKGLPYYTATRVLEDGETFTTGLISSLPVVTMPAAAQVQVLNGNEMSLILDAPDDPHLLDASFDAASADWMGTRNAGGAPAYQLWRLGTTIAGTIGLRLVTQGVGGMLKTDFQVGLTEKSSPFAPGMVPLTSLVEAEPAKNASCAPYFSEIFFHIPYLIANHLNSQQKFADAQRWYHYLFDPTANEQGVSERIRPWRYRGFREGSITDLRSALTAADALDAYRKDPGNPHAIARLRGGAYQKAIVMKYIDNLLDWGDALFTQFTMESVNEATMKYVMAADILGPKPIRLGPCDDGDAPARTYENVAPLLNEDTTDLLIEELEAIALSPSLRRVNIERGYAAFALMASATPVIGPPPDAAGAPVAGNDAGYVLDAYGAVNPAGWNTAGAVTWKDTGGTALATLSVGGSIDGAESPQLGGRNVPSLRLGGDPVDPPDPNPFDPTPPGVGDRFGPLGIPPGLERDTHLPDIRYGLDDAPHTKLPPHERIPPQFKPFELAQSRIVFCIPENKELLAYWDRVEDRLNKIRNCMDIAGVRRRLELFAPEIDPRLLVRMRAAGLTLDDVMNVTSGQLPPYRFTYLIEKARQHATVVQTFGNQVLSALEKRDGEELNRLRTVHEQHLLKLRSRMTQLEIDAAEDTLQGLERQKAAAELRRDHFAGLTAEGLSAPERLHEVSTHLISTLASVEAAFALGSAIAALVPNGGAPTAMTYGGREVHESLRGLAHLSGALSVASRAIGESASIEGGFQRRAQEWKHQSDLARKDIEQLDKQIDAAKIRRDIAIDSRAVHEKTMEQNQEVFDFLRDRFTNFGRYTWLSAEMQKLHRLAFNAALSMARLAEQACRFERPHDAGRPMLGGDYWDAGQAGLLAGDRLLMDLQNLEQRYIETNYRTPEIEQSFSLARFDPNAVSRLRSTGSCPFQIPEWFFDLTYSGHYRRRIKSVRLTIPCVVGPYINVGATLKLTGSFLRAAPDAASRVAVPLQHTTSIAASSAQNDAGVFELSFRDERYLPFEGAGVDSTWELTLPQVARPFDYASISDVILRINYTSEQSTDLKTKIDGTAGSLVTLLTNTGIPMALSLRHDFPDAWQMLAAGAASVEFEIGDLHVPFMMSGFSTLASAKIDVLVDRFSTTVADYPSVSLDGAPGAAAADNSSGLFTVGGTTTDYVRKHTLAVTDYGAAGIAAGGAGTQRLDTSKVSDIVLRTVLKKGT